MSKDSASLNTCTIAEFCRYSVRMFMFQRLEAVSVQDKTCMNNYIQQLLFRAGTLPSQELAVDQYLWYNLQ